MKIGCLELRRFSSIWGGGDKNVKGESYFSDEIRHAVRGCLINHFPFRLVYSSHFSFIQGEVNY